MKNTDIAIIGLSSRFPGSKNHLEFWDMLQDGREGISFLNNTELINLGVDKSTLEKGNYVKASALIKDIDLFDASYFGFSPLEASILSPQHRLALECSMEALENAGYGMENQEDRTGVYLGVGANSYLINNVLPNIDDLSKRIGYFQIRAYNLDDTISSFVSYKLNLKGPSISVKTACSSSLVAIHQACQSLITYESDMAISGGVSLEVLSRTGYLYEPGNVASPDGHCRTFDADGKGTIMGGGIGIVVLKRLSEAIKDNDTIYGVIEGSAINNDGIEKVGFTAPSVQGQADVIIEAQEMADIHPEEISYIEAHGTGTIIGDPIEFSALTNAFRQKTNNKSYCALGSVKTNIGHMDVAAGVAGLIKTTLALNHKKIPPSLHFNKVNPNIDLDKSPFYVNTKLRKWDNNNQLCRAGVSSFGIGGTNAHLIVREAPIIYSEESKRPVQIVTLSAKTDTALKDFKKRLCLSLKNDTSRLLEDIAYTLAVGRKAYQKKCFIICSSIQELIDKLDIDSIDYKSDSQDTIDKSLALYPNINPEKMIWEQFFELYDTEPLFKESCDKNVEKIYEIVAIDISILFLRTMKVEELYTFIQSQQIQSIVSFAISLSLFEFYEYLGIIPEVIITKGKNLFASACFTKILSIEEAILILCNKEKNDMLGTPKKPRLPILLDNNIELSPKLYEDIIFWTYYRDHGKYDNISDDSYQFDTEKLATMNSVDMQELLQEGIKTVYEELGKNWLLGHSINWELFYQKEKRKRIPLPTYSFEKKRYWIEQIKKEKGDIDNTNTKQPIGNKIFEPSKTDILVSKEDIEQELIELYRFSLGIHTINTQDDFFQFGGNSLLAVKVISNINQKFNIELQTSILINTPTIHELASYIKKKYYTKQKSISQESSTTEVIDASLVVLQNGEKYRSPLVFIHDISGDIYSYQDLLQNIEKTIPIIGFIAKGLNNSSNPTESISEMASNYLKSLLNHQPIGPYNLVGYSFGGIVAYEMAQQLNKIGKNVSSLTLIDTPLAREIPHEKPSEEDLLAVMIETLFEGTVFSVQDLKNIPFQERMEYISKKIQGSADIYSNTSSDITITPSHLEKMFKIYKANVSALVKYDKEIKPYDGKITFLKAEKRREKYDPIRPEIPWIELTNQNCEVQLITEANHMNIIKGDNAREIAKHINKSLIPIATKNRKLERTAIMFPGQGSQYRGMGKGLFQKYPDETKLASSILGYDIKELCLFDHNWQLTKTKYTQPAVFVVNSLHYLEKTKNMTPSYLLGHSLGEINALLAAETFDFTTGIKIVKKRADIMHNIKGGGMAAVLGIDKKQLHKILIEEGFYDIEIVNYNSPSQTVIAGIEDRVYLAVKTFTRLGIKIVPLFITAAGHSSHMKLAAEEFGNFLKEFTFSPLKIPVISNYTALPYTNENIANLLSDQLYKPVKWIDSIHYLLNNGILTYEEIRSNKLIKMVDEIKNEYNTQPEMVF